MTITPTDCDPSGPPDCCRCRALFPGDRPAGGGHSQSRPERLDSAVQRQEPRRLDAEVRQARSRRELQRHLPRRERPALGPLRQVADLQRRVRPHVLQGSLQLLRHRRGIPLRRRAGDGRRPEPGVGDPQQRPDAPRARSQDHAEGSGLPDLHRGAAARRLRQAADDGQPVHAGHQRRHETASSRPGTASTRSRRPTRAISGCASRCSCTATS